MKSARVQAPGQPLAAGTILAVTGQGEPEDTEALSRARAFAQPLLAGRLLDTGEPILDHADGVAAILQNLGGSQAMQAASYLVYACDHLNKPAEVIAAGFGQGQADLALETTKLVKLQRQARLAQSPSQRGDDRAAQTETVRKMLLAFSRDLRVVMLRLASRLQTLRYFAASKQAPAPAMAHESLHVFAPLANRLGIWQLKWELEDLAFRFTEPQTYRDIARLLDEKRLQREDYVKALQTQLQTELRQQGMDVTVQGRPKHIYSIVRKMRGKSLGFEQVFDVRALRVIAPDVKACYAVLAHVHERFAQVEGEFDDYIARPKPNGYQSLHTVVRDAAGRAIEIQIRTPDMHAHAESGVAAHWAYKEAGNKGYAGVTASGPYEAKIAVLRQLLAWEREMSGPLSSPGQQGLLEDRIYVLTPEAAVVELAHGATPVDFAYSVHTNLGHRCRGARVDGALVTLNTPLRNGQTVEIIAAKEGGPSRDWLNPELGFLASQRARAKVRAWFNALALQETVARGREAVEKLLQREGKTAIALDDLAARLGFKAADELFEVVGKDEFSLRTIENMLRPPEPAPSADDLVLARMRAASDRSAQGGVLVVGVDSLLTQLAKCCKPAPPDAIRGFVTRGKGVAIHRSDCGNFRNMAAVSPERVIEVKWNASVHGPAVYPVDIAIEAADRQGLLRDISEVFSREKVNVVGVQTQSVRDQHGSSARMTFTVEISDAGRLQKVLHAATGVAGVRWARRR
jgi:GTP pyrophosphokinase